VFNIDTLSFDDKKVLKV